MRAYLRRDGDDTALPRSSWWKNTSNRAVRGCVLCPARLPVSRPTVALKAKAGPNANSSRKPRRWAFGPNGRQGHADYLASFRRLPEKQPGSSYKASAKTGKNANTLRPTKNSPMKIDQAIFPIKTRCRSHFFATQKKALPRLPAVWNERQRSQSNATGVFNRIGDGRRHANHADFATPSRRDLAPVDEHGFQLR